MLLDTPLVPSLSPSYVLISLVPLLSTPPPIPYPIGCIPYPCLSYPHYKTPGKVQIFGFLSLSFYLNGSLCGTYTRSPLALLLRLRALTPCSETALPGEELVPFWPFCVKPP